MSSNPRSTASFMGHPLHPMIVPFPITFFVSAFAADLLYLRGAEHGWAIAGVWLLSAGLVTAALAAVLGLTDFAGDSRIRQLRAAWIHMAANVLVVAIEALNLGLRLAGNAGDTVGSTGVYLSGAAALLLMLSGWMGGELVFRHRVGMAEGGPEAA